MVLRQRGSSMHFSMVRFGNLDAVSSARACGQAVSSAASKLAILEATKLKKEPDNCTVGKSVGRLVSSRSSAMIVNMLNS